MESTEQEKVMQIVTSWMEQGIEQGLEQGLEQGAHAVILRLINRKFSQIPPDLAANIQSLSFSQTEALSDSLLDFASVQDLTHWLNQHRED
jgi:flagellar biosynthesis/type III secretory pathway protein FliH